MPEVQCSRAVAADLGQSWNFVKEMDNWAVLLPGYRSHEKIDDVHSRWTVRGEVGVLARSVDLEVTIDEWIEQEKVAFSLNGLTEIVSGKGEFRMLGPGATVGPQAGSAGKDSPTAYAGKRTFWQRLLGLFGRRKSAAPSAPATPTVPTVVPPGQSGFDFQLSLVAGGMIGPLVNTMLDSIIVKLCEEFATNVAAAIESGEAKAPGAGPGTDQPTGGLG